MLVVFLSKHTSPGSPSPQASGADELGEQYSEVLSHCCVHSLIKFWGAHRLTLKLVVFRSKHTSPSSPSPQASGIDEPGEQ